MQRLVIEGEKRISGEIEVQGAKNSALPLLAGCVLVKGEVVLHNCPGLSDVLRLAGYLPALGANAAVRATR